MTTTPIYRIQGSTELSPLSGQAVRTTGVVTGHSRKGFFIQDPSFPGRAHGCSDGLFVFSYRTRPPRGAVVEVSGTVLDYSPSEHDRATTQLALDATPKIVAELGPTIEPTWLDAEVLRVSMRELAGFLSTHEGMVCGVRAGATFVAPSNPFGDYLVLPPGIEATRTRHGGVLIDRADPHRWYPSFRILDYEDAPRVNVGARLQSNVIGPLNYRSAAFQIVTSGAPQTEDAQVLPELAKLRSGGTGLTVLTLNGFNLDPKVEDPALVQDPDRDVDDDIGERRYLALARAVAEQAGAPDVVALQEIQDNDGAEISEETAANRTLSKFTAAIRRVRGPRYRWADAPPEAGADGGQPGGNIRNAFLYNPDRVELVDGRLHRLGVDESAFEGSRKPVLGVFRQRGSGRMLGVINVHLASKRHQRSIFAPERPGYDPRNDDRVRQAECVRQAMARLSSDGIDAYVTGDFNDFEFSDSLRTLVGDDCTNLVETLHETARHDYNHRGISQALMHGVVPKAVWESGLAEYEVLHGNNLCGVRPGDQSLGKASDHAYVLARLRET